MLENQVKSRQDEAQTSQLHRHILQVTEYPSRMYWQVLMIIGINLPSQTLDNAFLEGEARRSAAFDHQLAMSRMKCP